MKLIKSCSLCYILWYEFKADEYFESVASNDFTIDQVIKGYYDAHNVAIEAGMSEWYTFSTSVTILDKVAR